MEQFFSVVVDIYIISDEYKYVWQAFQISPPDEHTWRKFTILIDWMEKKFTKDYLFDILGKSYDLEDKILCRIRKRKNWLVLIRNWLKSGLKFGLKKPLLGEHVI